MWETSRLPAAWPALLNDARAVIVPTRFVARVCRDSGRGGADRRRPRRDRSRGVPVRRAARAGRAHDARRRDLRRAEEHASRGRRVEARVRRRPDGAADREGALRLRELRPRRPADRARGRQRTDAGDRALVRAGRRAARARQRGVRPAARRGHGDGPPGDRARLGRAVRHVRRRGRLLVLGRAGDVARRTRTRRSAAAASAACPSVEDVADRLRWVAEHRDEARDDGTRGGGVGARRTATSGQGPGRARGDGGARQADAGRCAGCRRCGLRASARRAGSPSTPRGSPSSSRRSNARPCRRTCGAYACCTSSTRRASSTMRSSPA